MIRALLPGEIAARRRPKAILAVYLYELVWSILVAAPAGAWARRVWAAYPDGDAPVFQPGARYLMAWVDVFGDHSALFVVLRTAFVLLVAGVVLAQVPLAVLLAALATGEGEAGTQPRLGDSLRACGGSILALGGVLVLAGLVEGFVVGVGGLAAGGAKHAVEHRGTDAAGFWTALVVLAVFALVAAIVGVAADLARAGIVREVAITDEAPARPLVLLGRGIRRAARVGLRAHARAFAEWAPRAAIGLALFAFGALASEVLGGRGGLALAGLVLAHQVVILARVAVRASWLARALRIVGA